MNHIFKYLLGICLTLALCCCGNKQTGKIITLSELPPVTIPTELDSVIAIKNWMAIGPFEFNPLFTDPVKTFFREDLKRYKIKEGSIDSAAIENLQKQGISVFLIAESSPKIKLLNYIFKSVNKKSNFYLVSKIHSEKNQKVTLITDGSNSYSVWLNGDKQIEIRGKYNTNKASDRFVNISLKEGENTLFVKLNRGSNMRSWDLICTVAPHREAERIFRVNYAGDFVVNPIVNNSLEVYAGPYRSGKVEIRNDKDQTLATGSFDNQDTNNHSFVISDLVKLEEGFYKTVLTVDTERLEEMVYKGDYRKFAKEIKSNVDKFNDNSSYSEDLKAALQRVNFLNDKLGDPKSPSETRFLNKNRVFWGRSLDRMLQKNATTQLMTYKNQEGDSLGVFIFHKDSKLKNNIPLVIIVPSALQGNSMIEDWYASNLDQIETDNALADEQGSAVAWIYAGGKRYSADKTEKEISAVINRLHSEYGINDRKVFIMGDCEGGRRALVQLATTPDRYVACAVDAPITLYEGIDRAPIDLLPQMSKVPIMIRHGVDDNVSPVENARVFYAKAQKLNMPVEYVETGGSHISLSKDNHKSLFEFFSWIISKQK